MTAGVVVSLLLFLVVRAPGLAQEDLRNAHGTFTGEIKPVLYVTDVEKSAPFYRDVLGFAFEGFADSTEGPYYAEMAAAGVKFGLHDPTSTEQEARVGQERLYFRVEDLEAHRSRVLAWGGKPGETRVTGWMDMFIVRDLDGNEIVFAVTDPGRYSSNPWNNEAPAQARGEDQGVGRVRLSQSSRQDSPLRMRPATGDRWVSGG
jgi:predicted enzyme related to lactoylglutathione lyase